MHKMQRMRRYFFCVLIFIGITLAGEQPRFERVGNVVKADPALDEIVPSSPVIEKVADGFKFTEGPVWVHKGYLLFSDIPNNVIDRWAPDGKVSVFLNSSGYTGAVTSTGNLPGSNGLTLDKQGRLTICEHGNRRVSRLERDASRTVLADRYEGKRLNSPNDLVYKSDGCLYFTDPPYGLPKQDEDPAKELPFNGIYRLCNGKLQLLSKDLTRPNGIAFTPDENYLYVANSDPQRKVWTRFEVKPDGMLSNPQLFYDVTSQTEEGLPDGMKVDQKGTVYATGPGGLWVFSPQGKQLGTIKLPEVPANCNWGDKDGKTLYLTARTGLYRIRLKVPGIRP